MEFHRRGSGAAATAAPVAVAAARAPEKGRSSFALESLTGEAMDAPRIASGIAELDRVTGGGFVKGSVILLGGEPGIGKSTLLIQAAAAVARRNFRAVYIPARRAPGKCACAPSASACSRPRWNWRRRRAWRIFHHALARRSPAPRHYRFDPDHVDRGRRGAPGTVTQVRAAAQGLIRFAKSSGAAIILVGHVTKDGQIAGPRVVEHMVDAVMSFEGDSGHHFRILRAVKNRFGATDEIGVFEMGAEGSSRCQTPLPCSSARAMQRSPARCFRRHGGHAPLLIEIQALVTPSALGTPRRAVVGWDSSRLAMVLPCWRRVRACASGSTTST